MSTNYYARKIPSDIRKLELSKLILTEKNYGKIINEVLKTFGNYNPNVETNTVEGGVIHLGLSTGNGERFIWCPNVYVFENMHVDENQKAIFDELGVYMTYQLDKDGVKKFIQRSDIEVYNEYGEYVDKDDFIKMACEFDDGDIDEENLNDKLPNFFNEDSPLRTELRKRGFNIKKGISTFYNDGLLFETTNDFF